MVWRPHRQDPRAGCSTRPDLIAAIEAYLQANNADPRPFIWTASAKRSWPRSAAAGSPSPKPPTNTETLH